MSEVQIELPSPALRHWGGLATQVTGTASPHHPPCTVCRAAFPQAPRHVAARFRMRPPDLRKGALGGVTLLEAIVAA